MSARHPWRVTFVAALCLVAVLTAACGTSISSNSSSNTPIQVGAAVGRTGYLSAVDSPLASGIQLAANTVNTRGESTGTSSTSTSSTWRRSRPRASPRRTSC